MAVIQIMLLIWKTQRAKIKPVDQPETTLSGVSGALSARAVRYQRRPGAISGARMSIPVPLCLQNHQTCVWFSAGAAGGVGFFDARAWLSVAGVGKPEQLFRFCATHAADTERRPRRRPFKGPPAFSVGVRTLALAVGLLGGAAWGLFSPSAYARA